MFKRGFHLGSCVVRPALNRVERNGQTLRLRPKSMDVLAFLAERPGQVASRDEVLAAVWADSNVAEEGLTRCIAEIRQALDDDVHRPAYVETVPKRGYRLIVPVEQVADPKLALPPDRPGLLVMPFDNLSQERQDGYLADGLTEEIISKVSRLTALRVISRTSTMSLKGTDKDVRALARQLDVQYVVEGSVRKSGRRLRISAQLIDAASDTHLWAGQYSGTLDALFEVQEGVSRAVAKALRLSLSADRHRAGASRRRTAGWRRTTATSGRGVRATGSRRTGQPRPSTCWSTASRPLEITRSSTRAWATRTSNARMSGHRATATMRKPRDMLQRRSAWTRVARRRTLYSAWFTVLGTATRSRAFDASAGLLPSTRPNLMHSGG